jgi:branched-chain amino acid transport system substrate-binding protein
MGELEDRLERLAEHRAAQIPPFSTPPTDELAVRRGFVRRNRLVVGIAACLVIALVIGGLLLFSRRSDGPTVKAPAGPPPSTAGTRSLKTEGVTRNSVKLGFIWSGTGTGSADFEDSAKACQARVDAQNGKGGVDGRKIQLTTLDDQSGGGNLTAAQDLVQNRHVFAVVNNSSFAFLSYQYLQGAGVPLIGGGFDGTYYGAKGNEDIISALGNRAPVDGLTYDYGTNLAKQLGATKIGSVAFAIAPPSIAAAQAVQRYAAPATGLEPVYLNTTVDWETTDVGPVVQGLEDARADAVYLPLVRNTELAIAQSLQQKGVPMKAVLMESGYSQATLDSPISKTLNSSDIVSQSYKPVELKNDPAVKQLMSDLEKHAGITGVPDQGAYSGYIGCDLAITGLQQAGKNPTGQGFVDGLHNLGTYKAADLMCQPIDISLKNYGKTPTKGCQYYVTFKTGKFVVMNDGKPIFGELVGDAALVKANNTGTAADVTTTSTP